MPFTNGAPNLPIPISQVTACYTYKCTNRLMSASTLILGIIQTPGMHICRYEHTYVCIYISMNIT